jgi:hypothetical protein
LSGSKMIACLNPDDMLSRYAKNDHRIRADR